MSTPELLKLNTNDHQGARRVVKVLERKTSAGDRVALRRALDDGDPWVASLAAETLARQGDETVLGRCEELLGLRRHRGRYVVRGRIYRALEALPAAATLPLARNWRRARRPVLRRAAERLLVLHATAVDLPWIRRQLRLPITDRRVYPICSALEMLARFGGHGPFDEIIPIYHSFPYSYGRRFAVEAMRATDPEFGATLAFEALWDCEPESRERAANSVSDTLPGARARLMELAADDQEDAEVRSAAQMRIA